MLSRAAVIHSREAERRALFLTSCSTDPDPDMGVVVMLIVLAVLLPIIEINQLVALRHCGARPSTRSLLCYTTR